MLFSIILLATLIITYLLPWWTACILAFIVALFISRNTSHSFWMGFCGMGLAWLAMAMLASFPNQHILAVRVAQLFHVYSVVALFAITAIIGGLAGGMSAMSGFLVRKAANFNNLIK
ncbi:hypothetical protein DYU05_20290 [Mucilaginibacter terrenus]|uniref:Uncharacterized protein n=1 Tax=Mucilaginibacter terrenus TaxID=2482727 RepID=A0A3E2NJD6_9SPHI|nr:hypothetical protein [Mucilaginibacter terrenus]RFZ81102.1 hypothetical protein DYU05_20290 [Mucilaginibacter terrenus]